MDDAINELYKKLDGLENEIEQLTIDFIEVDNKLNLRLLWDKTRISIPVN